MLAIASIPLENCVQHLPVTFFYPFPDRIEKYRGLDPDQHWSWMDGFYQTYLRLKLAGYPVQLSTTLPSSGILVLFANRRSLDAFLEQCTTNNPPFIIVAACADKGELSWADFQIVQNRKGVDDRYVMYVPFLPQPGLIPRDPSRGSVIENIAYKGARENLNQIFRSQPWFEFLQTKGLNWRDETYDCLQSKNLLPESWSDYRSVDLTLAVRQDLKREYRGKPANKLFNSWKAGVPALLGPEYAYRELRISPLDYFEIASLEDAFQAIEALMDQPRLYEAMVENGLQRAEEYTAERILQKLGWVLFDEIPRIAGSRRFKLRKAVPLNVRKRVGKLWQALG